MTGVSLGAAAPLGRTRRIDAVLSNCLAGSYIAAHMTR
jgi:hypothetical protein